MRFKLEDSSAYIKKAYDLFICSASYETRCLSFVRNCPAGRLGLALLCYMKEFKDNISENLCSMRNALHDITRETEEVSLSQNDPIFSTDIFIDKLSNIYQNKKIKSVLFDVTTFTHEMVLIILRVFNVLFPQIDITFVYSNADNYDPKNTREGNDVKSKWLSKGISEIRSVVGYPGNPQPINPTHLIIVVGYEYDRALSIIAELEPSSLSLAFGKSDSVTTTSDRDSKHYGAKEHFNELTESALAYFPDNKFHNFEISCDDPIKTKNEIFEHLRLMGIDTTKTNVMIFALNNKPSTLGIGLVGIEDQNIQLGYAPALVYNCQNYSSPGQYSYFFENIL
ncbi:MAG: hypothetical protein GX625_06365 [Clostridiaceae bacterium]|nr:hypothetical protein [Clostridiaceae bacterium]